MISRAYIDISAVIISCDERRALCEETIGALRSSDWGDRSIDVIKNPVLGPPPEEAMLSNSRLALEKGAINGTEFVLFLEDDLLFNRYLIHNLSTWEPVVQGKITVASLYDPGVFSVYRDPKGRFFVAHPLQIYGSQAFLITSSTIHFVLMHWDEVQGLQDIRISRLAARLQLPIYYHIPSLVQHIGRRSTWGGRSHRAHNFDPSWPFTEGGGYE